jgi:hypothetical protein
MGPQVEPKIAVIVVAYQSDTDVARCVASLKTARELTPGLELWLIDNSLDLDVRKRVKGHLTEKWMHYQYFGENVGFAEGNNLGFKAALEGQPDFFFMLNADAAVAPDCLANLLTDAAQHPAAAYGPLMTYADGTVYYAGGYINYWLAATFHPGRQLPPRPQTARPVSFINGCGLLLPRASYERWGGLPADFFMYYEEAAWCARVQADGGLLLYVPEARLIHYTPKTTNKSVTALYYLTRNQWLFARQYTRWYHKITAYPAITVFQLLRYWKFIGKRQHRQAIVQAWRDAFNHRYGQMV